MIKKAKLISRKPKFAYEVDNFKILFIGTEFKVNQFHYEQFVRICINDENNPVGIVHHVLSEGEILEEPWFSLDCMRERGCQSIFKAHKLLFIDLGIS